MSDEIEEPAVIAMARHPLHDVWAAGGDAATSRDFRDKEGELDETAYIRYGLNVMTRVYAEVERDLRAKVAAEIRAGIAANVTKWNVSGLRTHEWPSLNGQWYRGDQVDVLLDRIAPPAPECTCPDVSIGRLSDPEPKPTMKGRDPNCPEHGKAG